jgi:hypothetical protein
MKNLKENYKKACNDYAREFCKKHGYEFSEFDWVANMPGTLINIADYFVDMVTIIYDVENDVPEDKFLKWYDYSLRAGTYGIITPNFSSWVKGCPIRSEEDLNRIEKMRERINELEKELKEFI